MTGKTELVPLEKRHDSNPIEQKVMVLTLDAELGQYAEVEFRGGDHLVSAEFPDVELTPAQIFSGAGL